MEVKYLVEFENESYVFNQAELSNFLRIAVLQNKDITTFNVTDLSHNSFPQNLLEDILKEQKLEKKYLPIKGSQLIVDADDYEELLPILCVNNIRIQAIIPKYKRYIDEDGDKIIYVDKYIIHIHE